MSNLFFVEIKSLESRYFEACWHLYEQSFPLCERRERGDQVIALGCDNYHFEAILVDGAVVGVLGYWLFDGRLLFVEHIAMESSQRGGGFGTRVLERLKSMGNTIVLEIEPVVDDLTRRRLGFYERSGFVVCRYNHCQPPFRDGDGWLPLVVLSYPSEISAAEYELFRLSQIEVVKGSI